MVTEVEASTPAEAEQIALNERGVTGLVHGAETDGVTDAWCTTGELDCTIEQTDIVEVRPI